MEKIQIIPSPKIFKELLGKFIFGDEIFVNINEFSSQFSNILKRELKLKNITISEENPHIEFLKDKIPIEGYCLKITPKKIIIKASSDEGIYYAIKTLKQIKRNNSCACCEIEDSPDIKIRGVMIDISRSKVPTLSTLKSMVDLFSDLKYNHLELYVEGFSYEYSSFPELLKDNNYIKLSDYLELEKYANEHYIDLVPNQNGFGHMTDWLSIDKYKALAECPDGFTIWGSHRPPSTIDPTNKNSYKLVKKMYEDMLPHFKSKYFNMNFDEPYELGYGKSKEKCDATSKEDVFIEYLTSLTKVVRKYDKIPLIWGDVLINHSEAIPKIPKDVIVIDWGYHKMYDFDKHAKMLNEAKRKFMVAPGTVTWSNLTCRYEDMFESIKNSANACKKYDGLGILITDWGDIGHLQYLPFSYPGFIFGAVCSWGDIDESAISTYLKKLVGEIDANVILELSKYTLLEGDYRDYGSRLFSPILWAEHSSRQSDQVEFFLSKMKYNLIEDKNLKQLDKLFREKLIEIKNEESLINAEIENTINLLLTLVDIQFNLKEVINNKKRGVFDKDIMILDSFLKQHELLWKLRNIEAGIIPSSNRIKWLMNILIEIDERR